MKHYITIVKHPTVDGLYIISQLGPGGQEKIQAVGGGVSIEVLDAILEGYYDMLHIGIDEDNE